jgi:hypothetical protein
MRSWRDYTQQVLAPPPEHGANSAISANRPRISPQGVAFGTTGTNGTLEPSLVQGLAILALAAAPRLRRPEVWPQVVDDARRLAADGWAAQALRLGWMPLHLFGAMPDREGDPACDGLAVKLSGRRVLAICSSFATVEDDNGGRSYLHRGTPSGARLLWELGRE